MVQNQAAIFFECLVPSNVFNYDDHLPNSAHDQYNFGNHNCYCYFSFTRLMELQSISVLLSVIPHQHRSLGSQ